MQRGFLLLIPLRNDGRYTRGSLQVLNQLKLPHETEYVDVRGAEDAFDAIKTMMVGDSKRVEGPAQGL